MIPRSCKRLAEVGFPIAEVSRQAVREKSIRRGHPYSSAAEESMPSDIEALPEGVHPIWR